MRRRSSRARRRRRRFWALVTLAAVASGGAWLWTRMRERASETRVATLEATRETLRDRLASLRVRDPVVASAPEGDLLIGVPEAVGTELLVLVTKSLLPRLDVELRDLRLLKAGEARVGTPFGRRTAGAYALDVHVHEVRARLEPGPPEARFAGKRIDVALPVRLTRGEGRATLRLRWDSKGMAGAVCGDFQARIAVEGTLVPRTYPVKGSFGLDLEGGRLTAVPSFPDLELRLEVEPRPATWRAFGRVLRQRSWRCRAALGMVDVPGQVRRLLHKGLRVKIPPRVFKPLPLPAAASPQVTLEGRTYRLDVTPRAISIGPRVVWYSAAVRARRTDEPPASPQPSPPPALEAPESGTMPSSPGPTSDSPSPQPTPTPSPEPLPTPSPEPTPTPSPTPPPPLD